jgi:hypothetical protein
MTFSSSTTNTLQNPGQTTVRPPNQFRLDRAPTTTDINANIGDEWEDYSVTPSVFYKLVNLYYNIATWKPITGGNFAFQWAVTTTNQTLATNKGWFSNGGSQLQFTLPATCAVGDTYEIVAMNAAGWIVRQLAGQQITVGINQTTLGATGSIASLNRGDWIRIVCNVANTGFFATILEGNCVTV